MSLSRNHHVSLSDEDGAVVVLVRGEIDLAAAPTLRDRLREAGDRSPAVVVDMADTTFLDSSGLHVLVRAHAERTAAGGTLVLRSPSTSVTSVLAMAGIAHLIPVEPTDDDPAS